MTATANAVKALFPTETSLCELFIAEFNGQPGWTCYPETGGFDIVVAHESGRQIGVEAKLRLNAKVADQILPSDASQRYTQQGPDHRLVIVASITEANAGIAKMLGHLGVEVWVPRIGERIGAGYRIEPYAEFGVREKLWKDEEVSSEPRHYGGRDATHFYTGMFDWNPIERLQLPDVAPSLPAGVPCPIQLTPWKQAALRVLARLRVQGSITAREITAEGCSPSMWTQRWLDRGAVRGGWVETDRLPKFDEQHPDVYAVALERAHQAASAKETA